MLLSLHRLQSLVISHSSRHGTKRPSRSRVPKTNKEEPRIVLTSNSNKQYQGIRRTPEPRSEASSNLGTIPVRSLACLVFSLTISLEKNYTTQGDTVFLTIKLVARESLYHNVRRRIIDFLEWSNTKLFPRLARDYGSYVEHGKKTGFEERLERGILKEIENWGNSRFSLSKKR